METNHFREETWHVLGMGNPTQNNTISSLSTHRISHKKLTFDAQKPHFGRAKARSHTRHARRGGHYQRLIRRLDAPEGKTRSSLDSVLGLPRVPGPARSGGPRQNGGSPCQMSFLISDILPLHGRHGGLGPGSPFTKSTNSYTWSPPSPSLSSLL